MLLARTVGCLEAKQIVTSATTVKRAIISTVTQRCTDRQTDRQTHTHTRTHTQRCTWAYIAATVGSPADFAQALKVKDGHIILIRLGRGGKQPTGRDDGSSRHNKVSSSRPASRAKEQQHPRTRQSTDRHRHTDTDTQTQTHTHRQSTHRWLSGIVGLLDDEVVAAHCHNHALNASTEERHMQWSQGGAQSGGIEQSKQRGNSKTRRHTSSDGCLRCHRRQCTVESGRRHRT